MVIGSGLIGSIFYKYKEDENVVIFASGISNSQNNVAEDMKREENLILQIIEKYTDKLIVYFSTCSIYDESKKEDPYILHKLNIESILATKHKNYLIFRITNPIGKTKNKTTFLNYFIDKIKNDENFEVWSKSSRNIIDIEDLYKICDFIIRDNKNKNKIINIGSPNFYSTSDIVNQIESHLNKKGRYHIVNKGGAPIFDNSISNEVSKFLNINFKNDYLDKILKKYFPTDELLVK